MGCCGSTKKERVRYSAVPINSNDPNVTFPELPEHIMNNLLAKTKFTSQEILDWWQGFLNDCPSGLLDKKKFREVYQFRYPNGNAKKFCNYAFRTFNPDKQLNAIDFENFMCAIDVTLNGTPDEKLEWAFTMYDINGDDRISKTEMTKVIQSMFDLSGKHKKGENKPRAHVERIFARIDSDHDNYVSKQEFLSGCKADEQIRTILAPHY